MRDKERQIASNITDDHIIADEQGVFVGEIFPNLVEGYILCDFNGQNVEDWPFVKVSHLIRTSKSPHIVVFKRYDFKQIQLTGEWLSLHELREMVFLFREADICLH